MTESLFENEVGAIYADRLNAANSISHCSSVMPAKAGAFPLGPSACIGLLAESTPLISAEIRCHW